MYIYIYIIYIYINTHTLNAYLNTHTYTHNAYLLNCTPISCSYSLKGQNKSKTKLEEAVSLRCSVRKVLSNVY